MASTGRTGPLTDWIARGHERLERHGRLCLAKTPAALRWPGGRLDNHRAVGASAGHSMCLPGRSEARRECHLQTHTRSGGKGVAEASARQRCTVSSRATRLGGNAWGTPLEGWAGGVVRKPRPPRVFRDGNLGHPRWNLRISKGILACALRKERFPAWPACAASTLRCAPPSAIRELPFPASVVNTAARKRNGLRAVGGGDRRTFGRNASLPRAGRPKRVSS